jgi:hypothetical protein
VIVKSLTDEQVKQATTLGGWGLAVCVVLYLLYQYVLWGIYLGPRADKINSYDKLTKENAASSKLLEQAARDDNLWAKMELSNFKEDPDARDQLAEQVKTAYYDAARQAGFSFNTWSDTGTFPSPKQADFKEVRFTATAMLTTNRLAGFLYTVEHYADLPARVDQLNIRAQTPGTDYLHVDMSISALLYSPEKPVPPLAAQAFAATKRGPEAVATNRGGRVTTTRPTTTRPVATRAELPVDPEAEKKLMERRAALEAKAEADLKAQEEFLKLSPEEQEAWLQKKHEADAIAATQKEADDAIRREKEEAERVIKQQRAEEEMLRRRLEEEGVATTNPAPTTQGGTR